jgi:hypothetical protein
MATEAQQKQPKSGVGIFAALAGMLVTFLLGFFVGLHPSWIPFKTSSADDNSAPVNLPATGPEKQRARPSTTAHTQPAKIGN